MQPLIRTFSLISLILLLIFLKGYVISLAWDSKKFRCNFCDSTSISFIVISFHQIPLTWWNVTGVVLTHAEFHKFLKYLLHADFMYKNQHELNMYLVMLLISLIQIFPKFKKGMSTWLLKCFDLKTLWSKNICMRPRTKVCLQNKTFEKFELSCWIIFYGFKGQRGIIFFWQYPTKTATV